MKSANSCNKVISTPEFVKDNSADFMGLAAWAMPVKGLASTREKSI
jgi:hypothetical protein